MYLSSAILRGFSQELEKLAEEPVAAAAPKVSRFAGVGNKLKAIGGKLKTVGKGVGIGAGVALGGGALLAHHIATTPDPQQRY